MSGLGWLEGEAAALKGQSLWRTARTLTGASTATPIVELDGELLQLEGPVTRRVETADHGTGAGAHHHIRLDAAGLEGLDHAHMGKSARCAAAQRQADARRSHGGCGQGRRGRYLAHTSTSDGTAS